MGRLAYFTIPLTGMAAGWMAGVELGKIALGRKSEEAWVAAAIIPGGIKGLWVRCMYSGMRTSIGMALLGVAYQYSSNNNLTNTFNPFTTDNINPNTHDLNNQVKDVSLWWPYRTPRGNDKFYVNYGLSVPDPGPTYAKFEE